MMGAASDAKFDKPHETLAAALATKLAQMDVVIDAKMRSEYAPRIADVSTHLISAGGKRIRPLLVLAAAQICGYRGDYDIHLAATVEFIHTATLLHDDVVDESTKRRGRPAANLLWDNKSSILVGDYLFARAFQLMVEPGNLRILEILSNAAATIAEGEVLQLSAAQDLGTDEETYLRVVRGKTAALFSASTESGGVIAGASDRVVQALFDYGDALGIAFQIADDILDYSGQSNALGKNLGDDLRERKVTLPVIYAYERGDTKARQFWERVIAKGDIQDGDVAQAQDELARCGALDAARQSALDWSAHAKAATSHLPEHSLREVLSDLADFVVSRVR